MLRQNPWSKLRRPRELWRESRFRGENSESGGGLFSFKKLVIKLESISLVLRTQIRRKTRRGRKRSEKREQRREERGKSGKT